MMASDSVFFRGTVMEAIQMHKQTGKVLLVFFRGDDSVSDAVVRNVWSNEQVISSLREKFVALELTFESEGGKQFVQVYPVMAVPTIYFIGPSGAPLHILFGDAVTNFTAEEFLRLAASTDSLTSATDSLTSAAVAPSGAAIAAAAGGGSGGSPQAPTKAQSAQTKAQLEAAMAARAKAQSRQSQKAVASSSSATATTAPQPAAPAASPTQATTDKVSAVSPSPSSSSQPHDASSNPTRVSSDVKKKRSEAAEERARLKRLLAADKAERAEAKGAAPPSSQSSQSKTDLSHSAELSAHASSTCALAFRLTNGEVIKSQFSASSPLSDAVSFVHANRTDGTAPFSLSVVYPRRPLSEADHESSLSSLGLCPSSTLVLVAEHKGGAAGGQQGWVGWAIAKTWQAAGWLNPANYRARPAATATTPTATATGSRGTVPRSNPPSAPRTIHGLNRDNGTANDEDKDNKFWNGNSTQFQ